MKCSVQFSTKFRLVSSISRIAFITVLIFFVLPGISSAMEYYVSTTGINANDGKSINNPWKNISYGVSQLNPGDTLYILNGTWYNEHITFSKSGNSNNPIILTSYNGTPTLDGVDHTGIGITFNNNLAYINISNIKMNNYGIGIYAASNISNVNILNSTFIVPSQWINGDVSDGSYKMGVDIRNSHNYTFKYNTVKVDITPEGLAKMQNSGGIQLAGGSYINVLNNIFEGNATNLVNFVGSGNGIDPVARYVYFLNNYVANNTVHGGLDITGDIHDMDIKNNHFNNAGGLYVHAQYKGSYRINFSNNILHNGISRLIDLTWTRDSIVSNNTIYDIKDFGIYSYLGVTGEVIKNLTVINNNVYNVTNYYRLSTQPESGTGRGVLNIIDNSINVSSVGYLIEGAKTAGTIKYTKYTKPFNVRTIEKAIATVEFTDGRVFGIVRTYYYLGGNVMSPKWYSDKSNFTIEAIDSSGIGYDVITYPMTARPASGSANVTVNKFDTSLSQGYILVDFTANTTNLNNVDFTVGNLKQNKYYNIKRDGSLITTKQAVASGYIQFSNSEWSQTPRTFTIIESSVIPAAGNASGTTTNTSGSPISGVTVTDGTVTTTTDQSGYFFLSNIVIGTSNITASKTGYQTASRTITVYENSTVTVDFQLNESFSDTTPPGGISSLQNNSYAQNYITWTWIDPADLDFAKIMVYLNSVFQTNITKGIQSYTATGLNPDTSYTISTHTVDTTGNVNMTWMNHTARTAPATVVGSNTTIYDNRLKEGEPDSILNKTSYLDIGQIPGTGKYRDVIWFNLSTYKTSDKITSSILSLFWYYPENSGRNQSTTIEIYRPLSWDPDSVNWNNRSYGTPWNIPGGDWFDRNNAAYGSVPFASITFNASTIPDNRYYNFNVTDLVQSYVSGKYSNTGFFLKAKDEYDNYIAFYSSDNSNPDQRPKIVINYTTGGTPLNPAPSITSFSPDNITLSYALNSTTPFSVVTDQPASSKWYLNGANQNNNTQAWSHKWDAAGQYNVTYVGSNGNGSVNIMWNVTTCSLYDVDCNGLVNQIDRNIVWNSIYTGIYCQACDINNNKEVEVFDWVMVSGNSG